MQSVARAAGTDYARAGGRRPPALRVTAVQAQFAGRPDGRE
jgi:hypothetical protein